MNRDERLEKIEAECKFTTARTSNLRFLLEEVKRLEVEKEVLVVRYQGIDRVETLFEQCQRLQKENERLKLVEKRHEEILSRWGSHELRWQASQKENAELREKLGIDAHYYKEYREKSETLQSKLDVAVKALEWAMPYLEDLYGDFYSAKWLPGAGLHNSAGYKILHDETGLKTAREALAKIQEGR